MKQIVARTDQKDEKRLEELLEGVNHYMSREDDVLKVTIFVPDEKLDCMLDELVSIVDLRYKERMIEVYSPDFVISSSLKREEQKKCESKERTPVEEILDSVRSYSQFDFKKVLLIAIAGIVAMIGLFTNNVAIIIGAMLLSPMLGPIYAFSINVTVGKGNEAFKNIVQMLLLISVVILLSALATFILQHFIELQITDEIRLRMSVRSIYLVMAVFLGLAAILALTRKITEGLAGVAIAAALLPPASVTGILMIIEPDSALGALTITIENIIGLMTGGLMASIILDIVPRKYYERSSARRMTMRAVMALAVMIIILGALIAL